MPDRDNPADRNHRLARRAAHQLRDIDGTAVTLEQARAIGERATPKTLYAEPGPSRERTGEARSRQALHQPARPQPTDPYGGVTSG